ncbi:MAG: DUF116 domain-containing protein [Endomicrobia bacterium]|nr:DUF116 domain-containing protein [Endomicrobiia bacterium]MCL2506081.1 DUF116 domain-containing protein [Endomicrobiia bacterium]
MKLCRFPKKSKEQLYKIFTDKENKKQAKKFALTLFGERIVFAPHCMRNTVVCTAEEKDGWYICKECGGCKIKDISELVKKYEYKNLYILKGGRTIVKIIDEQKPKAIVGIACFYEGDQAFKILDDSAIAVQFAPLTKDGCSDTDVDLTEVENILKQQ